MSPQLRFALVLSLFAAVLALVAPSPAEHDWLPRCPRVPHDVGDYHGADLSIPAHWQALLETNDLLLRRYAREGEPPVTLCIVCSSRSRKVAHPPEVCYAGQGFAIEQRGVYTLHASAKARQVVALTVRRDGPPERVFAFYRSNQVETCSFVAQQLRLMADALVGRPLAAAFIRVSTPVDGDQRAADRRLERFLDAISPALEETLR